MQRGGATAICGCKDGTFRHPKLNRCVALAGSACTLKSDSGVVPITCTENANCWPNGAAGLCRCAVGATYHMASGECKLGHEGAGCNLSCDFEKLLICRDNRCTCPFDNMHFDPSEHNPKCRSRVGGYCDVMSAMEPGVECDQNMACNTATNICACVANFVEDTDGSCRKGGNDTCASNHECHSQFVCIANKCDCPADKMWDDEVKECRTRIGFPCNICAERPQCIQDAFCDPQTSRCQCPGDGCADPPCDLDRCSSPNKQPLKHQT